MKERIIEFLRRENKTSAQFAEEIGVQPSGISHIISGRNKPSLDFILKMLEKYPFVSTDWILFGKGSMYREPTMADMFENLNLTGQPIPESEKTTLESKEFSGMTQKSLNDDKTSQIKFEESNNVSKIVWFYDNGTFDEFYPRNR